MAMTDAEIQAKTAAAWKQLDPIEFDLMVSAYDAMETRRPLLKAEIQTMRKFAELCGLPSLESLLDEMVYQIFCT